ncbi:MAG: RidA family protein [Gemmatimonadaceae bacterium]
MTVVPIEPEGWPRPKGYASAVSASGNTIFISGQIGWDPLTQRFASDDFATQVRQALANIVAVLHAAGAQPEHVTRLTWFVTDRAMYLSSRRAIGVAYRELFGRHYPAMSVVVVKQLLEFDAKVEIEATAVI